MKIMKYLIIFLLSLTSCLSFSQSIEGVWKTYDDDSGKLTSDVKIYLKNGKLYGKIIKLYNLDIPENEAKCTLCKGYRKDKLILGMEIMSGLKKSGEEWTGDSILLDPDNGELYDAKLWLMNDNKLAVRGYVGWLYRTQYWIRK